LYENLIEKENIELWDQKYTYTRLSNNRYCKNEKFSYVIDYSAK